ncbi:ricin B lectin domain-containing protein [Mycena rebaudengoi]|nr:ricin B lectin domain-containing protein [Mycena rebaudengoi]
MMPISSIFVALSALIVSATAFQIQSSNPAFFNAGIQGCISTPDNANGSPLVIHNCNTNTLANQDWQFSSFTRQDAGPQPIKIFGDKCIDVSGGVNADGTKLQVWSCTGGPNQQWISKTDFTFQWSGTNKCIDLTDGKITDGSQLQLWTCDSNSNQKWSAAANPSAERKAVQITGGDFSATGNGPFCIAAASDTDGAKVALVRCADTASVFAAGNVTWTVPTAPLTGQIKTFGNKCLDVPSGSTQNGVQLQIWTCAAGNPNQVFQDHRGQIEWKGTGKCLDLTGGNSTPGNPIQLWDCAVPDNNPNQDWFITALTLPSK